MNIENVLRRTTGILLWSLSALFSVQLFLAFGDGTLFKSAVLALLSLGLESAKILCLRLDHQVHRLLSAILVLLSVSGSIGSALMSIGYQQGIEQIQQYDNLKKNNIFQSLQEELDSHKREISLLVERLAIMPQDYTTATQRLQESISQLRIKQSEIINRMQELSNKSDSILNLSPGPVGIFSSLGTLLGLPISIIEFIFAITIAIVLEWGAIALLGSASLRTATGHVTGSIHMPQDRVRSKILNPEDLDDKYFQFLVAMAKEAPLPQLHGRDQTARRLGLQYYDAKLRVRFLEKHGYIKVEKGRYHLLVDLP